MFWIEKKFTKFFIFFKIPFFELYLAILLLNFNSEQVNNFMQIHSLFSLRFNFFHHQIKALFKIISK